MVAVERAIGTAVAGTGTVATTAVAGTGAGAVATTTVGVGTVVGSTKIFSGVGGTGVGGTGVGGIGVGGTGVGTGVAGIVLVGGNGVDGSVADGATVANANWIAVGELAGSGKLVWPALATLTVAGAGVVIISSCKPIIMPNKTMITRLSKTKISRPFVNFIELSLIHARYSALVNPYKLEPITSRERPRRPSLLYPSFAPRPSPAR